MVSGFTLTAGPRTFAFYSLTGLPFMIASLLKFALWINLLQLRVQSAFKKERIMDLLLADIQPRELWPGLFAAPVLAMFLLTALMGAVSIAMWVGSLLTGGYFAQIEAAGMPVTPVLIAAYGLAPLINLLASFAFWIGAAAYVSSGLIRGMGGGLIIVARTIMFFVFVYLPAGSIQAIFAMAAFVGQNVGPSPPSANPSLFMLQTFLIFPVLTSLIALILYWSRVRYLRSPKTWNLLRARMEKP
jgi:hypothetical protein